jgi:hypothetical protein
VHVVYIASQWKPFERMKTLLIALCWKPFGTIKIQNGESQTPFIPSVISYKKTEI